MLGKVAVIAVGSGLSGLLVRWLTRRRAKSAPPIKDLEDLKNRYFELATAYYVAGRYAFYANLWTPCGNLFHHAIEMFLKGHLCLTFTTEELRKLGHNLPRIWRRFKRATGDARLDAFVQTIRDVHAFEAIRYPEHFFATKGATWGFAPTRADVDRNRQVTTTPRPLPRYELALEEVDRLVLLLFEICDRNPKAFLQGGEDWTKYLTMGNSAWPPAKTP